MSQDLDALIDSAVAAQRILAYMQGVDDTILIASDEKQAAILYRIIIIIGEATRTRLK